MSESQTGAKSRREFFTATGRVAGVSALAGVALPHVHAAQDSTVELALVGCGGRGTGAAINALSTKLGPVKLVAMADVVPAKMNSSYDKLKSAHGDQVDVPPERRFLGYDSFKNAMSAMKKGGVVILGTPPAFRCTHFALAIEKGLHCFMEKPVTVDGPTTRKMLKLGELSIQKNLKVGVGLMVRHCEARQELHDRIRSGQIGEIISMRAYRMGQGGGTAGPKPEGMSEVAYQISRFHAFLWASGGVFSDYYIHQIDECSWMKGAWPVSAHGMGGRHYRGDSFDQNFDTYSVQYVYPDGTRLFFDGRNMKGARDEFASYAHGTNGSAVIATRVHTPGRTRIYKGHNIPWVETAKDQLPANDPNLVWAFPQPEKSPYQLEWDHLMAAIREDKHFNEVKRGCEASLVTSMGRMAAHTGRIVTYEQILNLDHEFAPNVDTLTEAGPAPLLRGPDGRYPVPQPGIVTNREY
jgi:predicted dehydrogenase